LETIANPYTTVLGPPESGAIRINMAQSCTGLGAIFGMFTGAHVILAANNEPIKSTSHLYIPYLGIGIGAAVLLTLFIPAKVPDLHAVEEFKPEVKGEAVKPIYKRLHFTLGVACQFLYNAAQIGIFSFFINYAVANLNNLSDRSAGNLQTVAFALFAGGRVVGSVVLRLRLLIENGHSARSGDEIPTVLLVPVRKPRAGANGFPTLMAQSRI
jgi:FHS family L-fucose permease-like MFS transporter